MDGWCQALTASVIVAILLIAGFVLLIWVVIDDVKAYISKIAGLVVNLGGALFNYFILVIEYIKNPAAATQNAVNAAGVKLSEVIASYVGFSKDVDKVKHLSDLLQSKLSFYVSGSKADLNEVNRKIGELLVSTKVGTSRSIRNALDNVDNYILGSSNSTLYRVVQNVTDAIIGGSKL